MLWSSVNFVIIALIEIFIAYLITFKYHSGDWSGNKNDSYYKPFETNVSSFNLWKYASILLNWTKISVYGVAVLSQILAFFGFFLEINIIIWEIGVFIGIASIYVFYVLLLLFSYELADDKCRGSLVSAACDV